MLPASGSYILHTYMEGATDIEMKRSVIWRTGSVPSDIEVCGEGCMVVYHYREYIAARSARGLLAFMGALGKPPASV